METLLLVREIKSFLIQTLSIEGVFIPAPISGAGGVQHWTRSGSSCFAKTITTRFYTLPVTSYESAEHRIRVWDSDARLHIYLRPNLSVRAHR